jgi:D-glycero-beta-D-manno-heptose 1-phosphate adenylyltransferase
MISGEIVLNKEAFAQANSQSRIIKDHKKIKEFVSHCRGLGLKIVLTQGTWDMVHVGHARYLDSARKYGDILIVGVDDDRKVKYRKGPDRPVVPENERLEMLTHLRSVDFVFLKHLKDPKWALIKAIEPDVLISIADTYSSEDRKALKKYCGEVVVMPRQATTSTSAKIRLLQINIAEKLGQALTPKVISAIDEVFKEVKDESTKKRK